MRDRELEIDEALSKLPGDLPTEKQAIAAIKKVLPDLSAKNAKNLAQLLQVRGDEPVTDAKGNVLPDRDLRDNENVPLPSVPVTYEADPRSEARRVGKEGVRT